jgi:hypothetical protein
LLTTFPFFISIFIVLLLVLLLFIGLYNIYIYICLKMRVLGDYGFWGGGEA